MAYCKAMLDSHSSPSVSSCQSNCDNKGSAKTFTRESVRRAAELGILACMYTIDFH